MTDATPSGAGRILLTRPTWVWAGILVLLSVVPGLAVPAVGTIPGVGWIGPLLLTAGLLLLAPGRNSVVARRALGLTALIVLAVWPIVTAAVDVVLIGALGTANPEADPASIALSTTITNVLAAVGIAAGIIAVVQIRRAGIVPRPLRGVPVIVFVLWVVPVLLSSAAAVALPLVRQDSSMVITGVVSIALLLGTLILGVAAIVGGILPRTAPTPEH